MITFNNSVTNINQTPGIISAPTAEQPAANQVLLGTIFINTTTGAILQSNGATWYSIGGGGSTPGIDDVLTVNQTLTDNREIDIDIYNLEFFSSGTQIGYLAPTSIEFGVVGNARFAIDNVSFLIYTAFNGLPIGTKCDFDNKIFSFGDFNNINFGTKFIINDDLKQIKVTNDANVISGLLLDIDNDQFQFGNEQYFFYANSNGSVLQSFTGSQKYGFEITDTTVEIGDYNITGGCAIYLDTTPKEITFTTEKLSYNGTAISATSAGGNSGKHLVIYLNGSPYKISLLNP